MTRSRMTMRSKMMGQIPMTKATTPTIQRSVMMTRTMTARSRFKLYEVVPASDFRLTEAYPPGGRTVSSR